MKIQDVMTPTVRSCTAQDSASAAAQAMWEGDLGCLPVVDERGQVIGMITDRDLAMAVHLRGAPLWSFQVADAMAKVVFSVKASDKVRNAAKLMSTHQLRRVPVVDAQGSLVGMLSLATLAQLALDKKKAPLKAKDVFAVFAAVTTPRQPQLHEPVVVEVVRESAPQAASEPTVIQPAPRKARKSSATPKKELVSAPKKTPAAKKARASK